MATERIEIVVTERGAKTVKRNLEEIGPGARRAEQGVQLLNRALAAVSVVAIGAQLLELVDTYTTLQNKLRVVTDGTGQLTTATTKLFEIANRTRTPVTELTGLYQKGAIAARELGASQNDLFDFVNSVGLALAQQGTGGAAASGALLQLSQSLGTGTIRAEEFNSILEGGFPIAIAAAKGIDAAGGSVGRLRQLVLDGKVTSQEFFRAIISQQSELQAAFAKTNPTIAGGFTVVRNNLIKLVGEFTSANGSALGFANLLLFLAENLETIARIAGAAVLLGLGKTFLVAAAGVRALTVALAANPLGALAVALASVISLFITFSDKINIGGGNLANLQDLTLAVWENIRLGLSQLLNFFQTNFGFIADFARDTFGDVDISITGVLKTAALVIDRFVGLFIGAYQAITRGFGALPAAFEDIFVRAINGAIAIVETGVNRIIGALNTVTEFAGAGTIGNAALGRISNSAAGGAQQLGDTVRQGFLEGFKQNTVQNALDGVINRANEIAKARIEREKAITLGEKAGSAGLPVAPVSPIAAKKAANDNAGKSFSDVLKELQNEAQLLQLSNREREIRSGLLQIENELNRSLTATEKAQVEELLRQNQALSDQAQVLDDIRAPSEEYGRSVDALNALLRDGKISLDEYNQTLRDTRIAYLETQRDLSSGAERAFLKIAKDASDSAAQIESLITNAFSKAEDVFVEFTKTGKLNFKDLISSIEEDLTRLAFRQLITAPLSEALGGALGGGGGGAGGIASLFGGGGAGATVSSPSGPIAASSISAGGEAGFLSGISSLFGFANGGEFQVGGRGGTDSQLVAFRASPNETVTVTKPGQSRGAGGGGDTIVINIQTQDADSFKRSDSQVLTTFASQVARIKKRNT
jgi:lambda family phage tail tape measure protein